VDGSVITLPNEKAMVARVKAEPGAFAVIYDHYFTRIYNYVRYRVGEQEIAEDITAQVFVRALARINQYIPQRGPLAGWLFGIARHAVRDYHRTQKRHHMLSLEVLTKQDSTKSQPEQIIIQNDLQAQVLKAVSGLRDREKELIALKFGARLTNREIAVLTGLTESNVGVILYRAVRKLRKKLVEKEQEYE
jgi:RNA polymerase sigma factor (sigma-70 family)